MSQQESKKNKFAIGALIGLAAGAIAGLLMAPKSGKETRKLISDKSRVVADELVAELKKLEKEIQNANLAKISSRLKSEAHDILAEITDVLSDEKSSNDKLAATLKKAKKVSSEVVEKKTKPKSKSKK